MSDDFIDPYIDPQTGILRNLVGASTYEELNNAEGELVSARMSEFMTKLPIKAKGSLDDLKFIHQYLFQDVYDWAGKLRTVEMKKASEGSDYFLASCKIATGLGWSKEELDRDNMLRGLSPDQFAQRLAYHYDNYNFVHPFREGNGRTQRLLWTLICHDAGYDLKWRNVSGEENNEASSLAIKKGDKSALVSVFSRIAVPCDPSRPLNEGLA